jgi:hypothetical protein
MMIVAATLCVVTPAVAQNTKATGVEAKTSTTTSPIGTSINPAPKDPGKAADRPSGTDRGNPAATEKSQSLDDPDKGLMGSSK